MQFIRRLKENLAFFILMGVLLTSCNSGSALSSVNLLDTPQVERTASPAAQKLKVALVLKTLTNPFFIDMEKGAREAQDSLNIDLIVKAAGQETSIEQQIGIVNDLIDQKVDAIVIAPGDSHNLIPVLKKAQDAGIIVITIDNRLDADYAREVGFAPVPYISVDNERGGYLSAKEISDQITVPTQVAILEGIHEAGNAQERKDGALRAFAENPNVELVASKTAHWKIDEGYQVTHDLLIQYPQLGAIFCANDMMALGAIQALDEAGRSNVLVAGYDALDEAKLAIRAGKLSVTIDQQAANQGYMGVLYAVRALRGEKLPLVTILDVIVITSANIDP